MSVDSDYHKDGVVYQGENKEILTSERTISISASDVEAWFVKSNNSGAIFEFSFNVDSGEVKKLIVFANSQNSGKVETYTACDNFSLSTISEAERRKIAFKPFASLLLDENSRNKVSLYKEDVLNSGCTSVFVKNVKCFEFKNYFVLAINQNGNIICNFVNHEKAISKTVRISSDTLNERNLLSLREHDFEAIETGSSVTDEILSLKFEKLLN